jgi:hypothetical protein
MVSIGLRESAARSGFLTGHAHTTFNAEGEVAPLVRIVTAAASAALDDTSIEMAGMLRSSTRP